MGLVRIGPIVLDMDDVRAIDDKGEPSRIVEVTFRDGSKMEFDGERAAAVRRFVLGLPDGLPLVPNPNDAATSSFGRRVDVPAVERNQGN